MSVKANSYGIKYTVILDVCKNKQLRYQVDSDF